MQALFDNGILILNTLIWECPNLIIGKKLQKHAIYTCFTVLGHIIDINLTRKNSKKLKHLIALLITI